VSACCCGTVGPHCPYCHMVPTHSNPLMFLVISGEGGLMYAGVDWNNAVTVARATRSMVVPMPIAVDFFHLAPVPVPAESEPTEPLPRRAVAPPEALRVVRGNAALRGTRDGGSERSDEAGPVGYAFGRGAGRGSEHYRRDG